MLKIDAELHNHLFNDSYHSSDCFGTDIADVRKSSTFAPELIRELF